ncbi:MAG: hydrogenase iron-sulfur subunit [Candidatus Bathyarchaeota archaeon]|nr:MAG: hydrogenase iron-sulfur subunit [Candidatus Bathyarchaeota archaeon]
MGETGSTSIRLDDNYCGRCSICSSICPYDAISVDPATEEVKIDAETCQFCGLCYSACPVNAIEIAYYNQDSLQRAVKKAIDDGKADTLVLMCRGNSPPSCEIQEILQGKGDANYIPLRVPCVGRIPPEFTLKMLKLGISKIVALRCEEDFCRFKEGSRINNQRFLLTKNVLEILGFPSETLEVIPYARRAVYDTEKCVGCDKCVFICPYDAIETQPLATPSIVMEKCVGCGACALVCPTMAMQLEGYQYETVSHLVKRYGEAARELKEKGLSPLILIFCCQWAEFTTLDGYEKSLLDKRVAIMEVPCLKGFDPYNVVEALQSGFDGVLAVVCSEDDCKLEKGYDVGERNTAVLGRVLERAGLQDRFALLTLSPRKIGEFQEHLDEFIERIGSLPPLPLKPLKAYAR